MPELRKADPQEAIDRVLADHGMEGVLREGAASIGQLGPLIRVLFIEIDQLRRQVDMLMEKQG